MAKNIEELIVISSQIKGAPSPSVREIRDPDKIKEVYTKLREDIVIVDHGEYKIVKKTKINLDKIWRIIINFRENVLSFRGDSDYTVTIVLSSEFSGPAIKCGKDLRKIKEAMEALEEKENELLIYIGKIIEKREELEKIIEEI